MGRPGAPAGGTRRTVMPMFRTAMVWLGLVDDDEYDGEDEQYYLDEEYDDPAAVAPTVATPRAAAARQPTETSQVAVFRGRHSRSEPDSPVATVPRPSSAVKAIPMPATRVH